MDEIEAARQQVFGSQAKPDVAARFQRWGGLPRYVLQLTDAAHQAMLDRALEICSLDDLIKSLMDINNAIKISHSLVHLTVDEQYLDGPAQFASEWVQEQLISKYLHLGSREVHDFLMESGGQPVIADFRSKLLERHAHEALFRGGTFACRDLQKGKTFHCEIQPCSSKSGLLDCQDVRT